MVTWQNYDPKTGIGDPSTPTSAATLQAAFDEKLDTTVASATYAPRTEVRRQPSRIYQQSASGAMASPPTFSASSSATISGQVIDLRTDPRIRWHGTRVIASDGTSAMVRSPAKSDGTFTLTPAVYSSIEFMVDAAAIEFKVWNGGSPKPCQLIVDGQRVSAVAASASATYLKYDFGGRRSDGQPRQIQFCSDSTYLTSILIAATDTLFPTPQAAPRLAGLGDSYMEGYAGRVVTSAFDGYFPHLAQLLGYECRNSGAVSNTGYCRTNTPYGSYLSRVPAIISESPDLVVVQGSINDTVDFTSAQVGAAATAVFTALRAGLPNTPIVATGILDARAVGYQTPDAARSAAISASAAALGIPFIDTANWVYGTGNIGWLQNNGNADIYTYTDNAHSSFAGGLYLASRLAGAIRAALPDLIP